MPVAPWADEYRRADHEAVREPDGGDGGRDPDDRSGLRLLARGHDLGEIAEVISRPLGSASTNEVALAQREQLAKELAAAQGSADPAAAAALRGAFARYSEELEVVGLTDAQLAAHYGGGRMRLLLLWSIAKIVAGRRPSRWWAQWCTQSPIRSSSGWPRSRATRA